MIKLCGDFASLESPAAARLLAGFLKSQNASLPADALVLLRSQAVDDLAGEIGPFLAEALAAPYVGVVTGVAPGGSGIVVTKELGRGLRGEFTLPLPAVLGIQSAEKPPRYVPIAKVRAAMKSGRIETRDVEPTGSRRAGCRGADVCAGSGGPGHHAGRFRRAGERANRRAAGQTKFNLGGKTHEHTTAS